MRAAGGAVPRRLHVVRNLPGEVVADRDALDDVVAHCRRAYPAEVCGLVGGREGRLERAVAVANVAEASAGRCGFRMDSRGQLLAMRAFEDAGLDLTGIYHSHPHSEAIPSRADVDLAAYPDVAYLIVSLVQPDAPDARAWRMEGTEPLLLTLTVDGGDGFTARG